MPLSIHKGDLALAHKTWFYPDSTIGVRLAVDGDFKWLHRQHRLPDPRAIQGLHTTISARVQTSADLMEVFLVTDALRRYDPETPIRLFLPFLPYAQQDRVCSPGEALSVRVVANLINSQAYERVTIVDPHSDVAASVLDRLRVITQLEVIQQFAALTKWIEDNRAVLVSPDAGASKKVASVARYLDGAAYVKCDKRRDPKTGEITETLVHGDEGLIKGRTLLCLDDLVVGGATFIAIAAALKARGAARVALYTTHGVYSKGTAHLRASGLDELFCTDSFWKVQPAGVGAVVLKLEEVFKVL